MPVTAPSDGTPVPTQLLGMQKAECIFFDSFVSIFGGVGAISRSTPISERPRTWTTERSSMGELSTRHITQHLQRSTPPRVSAIWQCLRWAAKNKDLYSADPSARCRWHRRARRQRHQAQRAHDPCRRALGDDEWPCVYTAGAHGNQARADGDKK